MRARSRICWCRSIISLASLSAKDIINEETGAIYVEAGDELTWELDKAGDVTGGTLKELLDAGITDIPVLDIDNITVGSYMRNTMAMDKNLNRDTALMDIYRVMRPGEPPTVEAASALFDTLFFDSERYDLSTVGRVKMNMRLALDAEDTVRTLRKEDIVSCIKALVELRDGQGDIDDIDHLGNRRVRSVGELMENQYRVGLLRMERAIKERMSSVEIDTVMPQDLINAKPAAAAVREFFRLVTIVAVHGPDQSAVGSHSQTAFVCAWTRGPDAGTCRVRSARRARNPLWSHVSD